MVYVRAYSPGDVTPVGWSVVCVPGMKPAVVCEPLGSRISHLVLAKREAEARVLLLWFGGEADGSIPDAGMVS